MKFAAVTTIVLALFIAAASASANRMEPVPLYGAYHMFFHRSRQTFNGHLVVTNRPLQQIEMFTTVCDASGCLAQSINKRPPPNFFDYHWVNNHWESVQEQQRQYLLCNDGSHVESIKIDVIKPNGAGDFVVERTIIVSGAGCPGEGAGKYQLPFTLMPAK